jgi:hypothetical protein
MDEDDPPAMVENGDEGLVYIIAHEAFNYLRRTKQVEGKNMEIDADAYAEELIGGFSEHRDGS